MTASDLTACGRIENPPWRQDKNLYKLVQAFAAEGVTLRLVGGAVRDALLGISGADVDMAANAPPERVMELAQAQGIKAIPTGISHGTITLVMGGRPYEITSLRADMEHDGRHAKTDFTRDWQGDAARRDFTINALYADFDGTLYDPVGGQADLHARRLRFIGDAATRIQEDRLRMLRYLRFYASYGHESAPDAEAIAAITAQAADCLSLSAERLHAELFALLALPDPLPAWPLLRQTGLMAHLLPEALPDDNRLHQMVTLDHAPPDALRRLAAALDLTRNLAALSARLRLSKQEWQRLQSLQQPAPAPDKLKEAIYRHGADAIEDRLFLAAAAGDLSPEDFARSRALCQNWPIPRFPLSGKDAKELGLSPSPKLGQVLKATEEWWITQNFTPNHQACLTYAWEWIQAH